MLNARALILRKRVGNKIGSFHKLLNIKVFFAVINTT